MWLLELWVGVGCVGCRVVWWLFYWGIYCWRVGMRFRCWWLGCFWLCCWWCVVCCLRVGYLVVSSLWSFWLEWVWRVWSWLFSWFCVVCGMIWWSRCVVCVDWWMLWIVMLFSGVFGVVVVYYGCWSWCWVLMIWLLIFECFWVECMICCRWWLLLRVGRRRLGSYCWLGWWWSCRVWFYLVWMISGWGRFCDWVF